MSSSETQVRKMWVDMFIMRYVITLGYSFNYLRNDKYSEKDLIP